MLSIPSMSNPPVEHITGFFVSAIFSINGQSVLLQLAIFKISTLFFIAFFTEGSSKGVMTKVKLFFFIYLHNFV